MHKYRHVINIGIQNTLVYRFNFLFRAGFGLIPLMATIYLWRAVFAGKQDGSNVVTYTLAEMTSYYLVVTIMDMLAFWVLEVSTFIFILFALEYVAGGHLFPLDILPPIMSQVLYLTPFPYQMFFPVSVYLGKTTGAALWQGLVMQALWVAVMYGVARFVWRRGIRKYAAFGG